MKKTFCLKDYRKGFIRTAVAVSAALLLTAACGSSLSLQNRGTQTWVSGNERATVTYYSLSDNSLNFIRLVIDGETHTLPQVVSADGTKYTEDLDIIWWEKGDSAFVQTRNDDWDWGEMETFAVVR
ncbi:hypothetical protein CSA37_00920 [Candidatus Fermentibacteria bacterium]|nr:MAG: hypothetical protein CSA37_00920 [Candidatus Fermentibacteria bacterium]